MNYWFAYEYKYNIIIILHKKLGREAFLLFTLHMQPLKNQKIIMTFHKFSIRFLSFFLV